MQSEHGSLDRSLPSSGQTSHSDATVKSRKRVRILYYENNSDGTVGGSYYSLLYLVQGLDRSRYSPLVVFQRDHILLPAFREAGIETLIWRPPKPLELSKNRSAILRPFFLLAQKASNLGRFFGPVIARAWFLRRKGIKIVHLNNSLLSSHEWMLAARLARVPCVTHERGINSNYPRTARFFGRRLGAIICISEAVRRSMAEAGADSGNLVTIHNGLDPAAFRFERSPEELRQTYGVPADAIVIGMIGNIRAWKGQDTLIAAMARVRRAYPDTRCLFIGDTAARDENYRRTLHDMVQELGLSEHVVFTGFQRNVADFVAMVDVVVHASVRPEPFGRVILEAMACGKPVIGARAGAIPEIIEEGVTGLTFPPGDHERLADAIIAVIRDPEAARSMGARGFARLKERFGIARNVESTQRVYQRLLGAPR
jgi:glycosyltransferase involved in cell wall biosynthesis